MLKKINNTYALLSENNIPIAYYKGEGKPDEYWIIREQARVDYYKKKLGKDYAESLEIIYQPLLEHIYPNMLGLAELFDFNTKATPEQKKEHKLHMSNARQASALGNHEEATNHYQKAWNLVTGVLKIGKINANLYKPDPNSVNVNTLHTPNDKTTQFESMFSEFLDNFIVEELHPNLLAIAKDTNYHPLSKQARMAKEIRELSAKGENLGFVGKERKGSSRAYFPEAEQHPINLDGKDTAIGVGLKVAIRAQLDKYHEKPLFENRSLGELQQQAENGDYFLNRHYRILTKKDDGNYETNEDQGIFPPLIDHDHENHQWSRVGSTPDVTKTDFRRLTVTPDHPKGISHEEFVAALLRDHRKNNGTYWEEGKTHEDKYDKITEHPLVQKFIDHQNTFGAPPDDYGQLKNMGVFTHPITGKQYIVARDHGFTNEVAKAYLHATRKHAEQYYQKNYY